MSVGKAIHARLKAHAGTTALVGTRIYPLRLPQDIGERKPAPQYPAVRYQRIGAPRSHVMGADTGEVYANVQVDCYGLTYEDADALSVQVRAALSRWSGTAGGIVVDSVFLNDERDVDEPTIVKDGEQGVYRVLLDFTVNYQE